MAYLPSNDRMELGKRRGSVVSQQEIHMQDIDLVNDERSSVWIHEMHVVSSTPIRARNIRKSFAPSPSHRPTLFRNASVKDFLDVSPVRKTSDPIRSSVFIENPDVQMNELGPSNITPTRTRRNISRQTLNCEMGQLPTRKDIHRNASKRAQIYASQRVEQYDPLVLLSDDEENIGQVNIKACQRKRIRNSKRSVQFRSSGKALISKCDSIDSGRGMSEAVSSGIRTVTSVGRGDDEESVDNDHESSSDSGVNQDPENVYENSQAISRISGPQSHRRIKNKKIRRQESEHAKQLIRDPVLPLLTSVQWKSGRTDEYPPLEVMCTDEDTDAVCIRKKVNKRGMKQTTKGVSHTKYTEQENNIGVMEDRHSGRIMSLKHIQVNDNLSSTNQSNAYTTNDYVKRKGNDLCWISDEECDQEEEEIQNTSLERLHYQRNFKRMYSHREISQSECVNDVNHSYSMNVNGNKVEGNISEENFEDEEMISEESLCDDDEVVLDNSRYGNTSRNVANRRSYINKPQNLSNHKGTPNFPCYIESSDIYLESDYEASLEMNGLIERNPVNVPDRMNYVEYVNESEDECSSDASGPIAEGSHRIESPHSSFIEDRYEYSKAFFNEGKKQQTLRKELLQDNYNQDISPVAVEIKTKKRGRPKKLSPDVTGRKVTTNVGKKGRTSLSSSKKGEEKDTKGPIKRKNRENEKEDEYSSGPIAEGSHRIESPNSSFIEDNYECGKALVSKGRKQQKLRKELPQGNINQDVSPVAVEIKTKKRGRPKKLSPDVTGSNVTTNVGKKGRKTLSSSEKGEAKGTKGSVRRKNGKNMKSTSTKSSEGTSLPESSENGPSAKKVTKERQRNPKRTSTTSSEGDEVENNNSDSEESVNKKCNAKKRKVDSVKVTKGKRKQQKSTTELLQDNINHNVSGATAEVKPKKRGRKPQKSVTALADSKVNTNGKKRGRPPSSSSEREETIVENSTSKRKNEANKTSTLTELSEDKNMLPKRKSLLNTAETIVQLSNSDSKENFIPEAASKIPSGKTSGSTSPLAAKRKSQHGSSSDYLRKKVLTMKLGNSLLHTSMMENSEHIVTSTPIKPLSGRSISSMHEKDAEQASIRGAAKVKVISKTISDNNKSTSEENHAKLVSEPERNVDSKNASTTCAEKGKLPPENILDNVESTSEENHGKAIPEHDRDVNDNSKKGKKTTLVLDSENKTSIKTSQPMLVVDEKLCLPSRSNSSDTQKTSKRRGLVTTLVDGKEKELELFSEYSRVCFRSRNNGTIHQDDKVQYGAGLDVLGLGTGYIHLAPGSEKGLQHPKSYNMVFLILDGTVKVKIHESERLTKPGDFFAVPKGCKYNLTGSGDKNAVVAYFRCKAL